MASASTVEHSARRAADSDWTEWLGRLGLAARGRVYCVVAVLAVRIATGGAGREQADSQGAIRTIAAQPFGRALLVVLAVGFAGYAAWRLLRAVTGRSEGRRERLGARDRAIQVGIALLYVSLLLTTLSLLRGESSSSSEARQRGWTAELMSHAWGEWVVAGAGLAALAVGAYLVVKGVKQDFAEHLERDGERFAGFGRVGYVARGGVIAVVGLFLVRAAIQNDPRESVGVDGALHRLAEASYGPVVLVAVALGLLAFGLYSFVEARYRRILET